MVVKKRFPSIYKYAPSFAVLSPSINPSMARKTGSFARPAGRANFVAACQSEADGSSLYDFVDGGGGVPLLLEVEDLFPNKDDALGRLALEGIAGLTMRRSYYSILRMNDNSFT